MHDGFSLTAENFISNNGDRVRVRAKEFGSVPGHLIVTNKSEYVWRIFIEKPTSLSVDVSYGFKGKGNGGKITVETAGESFSHKVSNTGLFVKEPGQESRLENYKSFRLGVINFTEPGYYNVKVTVEPKNNEEVDFQWIWLGQ